MRKRRAVKRDVLADPIYKSKVVAKLINTIMLDGKKGTAQKILYGAFEIVEKKTGEAALDVFGKALSNITPIVELKVRRVGGQNYQVPVEVSKERKILLDFVKRDNSLTCSAVIAVPQDATAFSMPFA